ncbi:MAG TPA: hypothetical protein V6C97_21795 [Oculatellaceae cyanobacterium]
MEAALTKIFSPGRLKLQMQRLRITVLLAMFLCLQLTPPAPAEDGNDPLLVSDYIAWWAHDDRGYHPAVTFLFQNESGEDISDQLVRFQARFLEIKNNYLSVTRSDIRPNMAHGEQRNYTLIGNEPYELPIDLNAWPQIECKVLYKIGDEAEAHQLLLARVDTITMTNEEALQRILSQHSTRRVKRVVTKKKKKVDPSDTSQTAYSPAQAPEVPLTATALPLNGHSQPEHKSVKTDTKQPPAKAPEKKTDLAWHFKSNAGLGDDFFEFEQAFGRPTTYDASSAKWTWAKYQPPGDVEVYAGARQPGSKADVVVAFLKSRRPVSEPQLINLGKEFVGKLKSQPLSNPTRSVRYLPSGRVQVTNLAASSLHFSIYSTNDTPEDNRYYVILSRLPSNAESTVLDQARRSRLLRFVLPVLGDAADQANN